MKSQLMKILQGFIGVRFLFLESLFLRFNSNICLLRFLLFFLLNLSLKFLPFFSYFFSFSFCLLIFILESKFVKLLLFLHLSCLHPSQRNQFFSQVNYLIGPFLQYLKHQYLFYFHFHLFQEFFAFSWPVLMTFLRLNSFAL